MRKYPSIADDISAFFSGGGLLDDMLEVTRAFPNPESIGRPISIGDLEIGEEIGDQGTVARARRRLCQRTP